MGQKDCTVTIRLPCRLKDDLQALANTDRRTLSDFLVLELEKIAARGKKRRKS